MEVRHAIRTGFAIALISFCDCALADLTIAQYIAARDSGNRAAYESFISVYVAGLGEGMGWVNTRLSREHQPRIFCPPPKLALGAPNYLRILDDEIREFPGNLTESFVGLVLMTGLIKTFPCATDP